MRKSVCDLTNEELLAIVQEKPVKIEVDPTDVTSFLTMMKFKTGNCLTPFSAIYEMYKYWSDSPTPKSTVGRELEIRFKKKRTKLGVYYLLAKNGLSKK